MSLSHNTAKKGSSFREDKMRNQLLSATAALAEFLGAPALADMAVAEMSINDEFQPSS